MSARVPVDGPVTESGFILWWRSGPDWKRGNEVYHSVWVADLAARVHGYREWIVVAATLSYTPPATPDQEASV